MPQCGDNPRRIAFGVASLGIPSIGIVPMGVVTGVHAMGVWSPTPGHGHQHHSNGVAQQLLLAHRSRQEALQNACELGCEGVHAMGDPGCPAPNIRHNTPHPPLLHEINARPQPGSGSYSAGHHTGRPGLRRRRLRQLSQTRPTGPAPASTNPGGAIGCTAILRESINTSSGRPPVGTGRELWMSHANEEPAFRSGRLSSPGRRTG
jgi:hypothetical protein